MKNTRICRCPHTFRSRTDPTDRPQRSGIASHKKIVAVSTQHSNRKSFVFLSDQAGGNYKRKLLRLVREGRIPYEPGVVTHLVFRHDGWCPALGGSTCRCDPDVEYFGQEFPYPRN